MQARAVGFLADQPELKESTFLSSRSAHSHNAASSSGPESRSTTPTPGNPRPDESQPPPPVARSGMLKIRVTAAKGLALPQGGRLIKSEGS
jgi:serum/glucocorticoid-regulated kinase 2